MKTINYSLLNGGEFDKYFSNGAGNLVSPREKLFFKMPKLSSLGGIFKRGKPAVKAPTPVAKPVVERVTMPGAGGRLVGPVGRGGGRVYNIGNITPTPVAKPAVKAPTPVAEPAVKAPSSSSRNVNTNTPKPENTNTPSEGNSNSGKGKGKGKEGSWWNNDYTKYALGAAGATGLGALGYGGYRLVSSD